jgi:hypothetical protein
MFYQATMGFDSNQSVVYEEVSSIFCTYCFILIAISKLLSWHLNQHHIYRTYNFLDQLVTLNVQLITYHSCLLTYVLKLRYSPRVGLMLPRVGVTYKKGFGLDDWIYCTIYIHTVRDYRQYSTLIILHTLQFPVAHALVISRQRIYHSLTVTSNHMWNLLGTV